MITTCHFCPRQISHPGSDRDRYATAFGWSKAGERYLCRECGWAERAGMLADRPGNLTISPLCAHFTGRVRP